jgi:putative nucleotidyltransferase-like protein
MRAPLADGLAKLSEADWLQAVDFADKSLLTLPLRRASREYLPAWLRDRTDADAARNRQRLGSATDLYRALDERLRSAGIEYLALKGLAQCPQFGTPAESRVQYDIDLFVPPESVRRAGGLMAALGFELMEEMDRLPTDHLPPFIRKTGWDWRGDYYDPEMPLAVELHFQFWNQRVERLCVPDVELFWERRTARHIAGIDIPVLCPTDGLGYTALHLLRHVLRGSARPFHIYEMAGFLDGHAADDSFWRAWRSLHTPGFRRLQAVMFRLAAEWFGCKLGAVAEQEVANLRAATRAWFQDFALSPASAIFYPQKDELWLHLSLLDSWRDRCAAARLRLLPLNVPGPVDAIHTPASEMTWRRRFRRRWRYAAHVASRLWRHAASLPHAARMGIRWWRRISAA